MRLLVLILVLLFSVSLVSALSVTLSSPANNAYSTISSLSLKCHVDSVANMSLYHSIGSAYAFRSYNTSAVIANTDYSFSVTANDGTYTWNCAADDSVFASSNYTVIVDTQKPSVSVTSPENKSYTTNSVSLSYSISDVNVDTCSYSLDSGKINTSLSSCSSSSITLTSLDGSEIVIVYAKDKAGHLAEKRVTFAAPSLLANVAPEITTLSSSVVYLGDSANMTLSVVTNENATCRYDNTNDDYDKLDDVFDITGELKHYQNIIYTKDTNKTMYVLCRDTLGLTMNNSNFTSFAVVFSDNTTVDDGSQVYSHSWEDVSASSKITYTIPGSFGLEKMSVLLAEDKEKITFTVRLLDGRPSSLVAHEGTIYEYYELSWKSLLAQDITSATLRFHVPQSWLNEQSVSRDDVVLLRYDTTSSIWIALETTFVEKEGDVFRYDGITDHFSYFALGSRAPSQEKVEELIVANATSVVSNVTSNETVVSEEDAVSVSKWWILVIVVGVIGLLIFLYLFLHRRESFDTL